MASSDSETTTSGVTRSRKSTPRARVKKNDVVTELKKKKNKTTTATATRRRASPRNVRKMDDETLQQLPNETLPSHDHEPGRPSAAMRGVQVLEDKDEDKTAMPHEVVAVPAQDTPLRRTYLQQIYRQLQSMHPHQDDTMLRQVATNMEMKTCQNAATRSDYVAAMDQEIHKLMQIELAQANASLYTSEGQNFDTMPPNNQAQHSTVSNEMQSRYSTDQILQSRSFEYAQALAKAQSQEANKLSAFPTPRQSRTGDNSFQSLMNNPTTPGYGHSGMEQQQQQQQQDTPNRAVGMQSLPQIGNQYYSTTSKMPSTSQNFSIQSNVGNTSGHDVSRNMIQAQHQLNSFQMQPQYKHQSGSMRLHQRVSTFQEFSAQIQHLDKSVLIELLWNQRGALAQWQRQAKQLELQLSARRNPENSMENSNFHSPYKSPNVGGRKVVCPSVSAEAEMQRARERNDARNMMSQYLYTQRSRESSPACSQAAGNGMNWGENVQVYWNKVRSLKATYADQLRIAKRALANNSAPPNTLYSAKAQSVMNNIGLVIDILSEQPTNVQPRKFDVLTSIERFIQVTVVPIVRKVQSSFITSAPQTEVALAFFSAEAASAATCSSENLPSGLTEQRTESHYTGSEWSSNTISDMSRQSSRETFTDSAEVKSSPGRTIEDGRMIDELPPPVESSPTNSEYVPSQFAPVRPESNDAAATQAETLTGQASMIEASVTPKEPSTPTSEYRLPTVSGMRSPSSPGDVMKDSKVLQSNVDVLNDFTDFSELDFDEDSSSFGKENNPSNITMKRGIDDV